MGRNVEQEWTIILRVNNVIREGTNKLTSGVRMGGELGGVKEIVEELEPFKKSDDATEARSLAPSDSLLVSPHWPYSSTHCTSSISSPSAVGPVRSSSVVTVFNCSAEGTVRTILGVVVS